jgi:hypothetical protein
MNQPTYGDIQVARDRIQLTIEFLRSKRGEFHLVEPSLSFESGALHALEWVLGNAPGGNYFEAHLESLRVVERHIKDTAVRHGV